jgi:hypothetical protein
MNFVFGWSGNQDHPRYSVLILLDHLSYMGVLKRSTVGVSFERM